MRRRRACLGPEENICSYLLLTEPAWFFNTGYPKERQSTRIFTAMYAPNTLTRANEDIPFKCSHTTAYDINVCRSILICWHTLIYVRGTLGIRCVRSTYADLCRWTLFSYAEAIVCRFLFKIDLRLRAYKILFYTCMKAYYKQDRSLINWQFIANACLKRRVTLIDKML